MCTSHYLVFTLSLFSWLLNNIFSYRQIRCQFNDICITFPLSIFSFVEHIPPTFDVLFSFFDQIRPPSMFSSFSSITFVLCSIRRLPNASRRNDWITPHRIGLLSFTIFSCHCTSYQPPSPLQENILLSSHFDVSSFVTFSFWWVRTLDAQEDMLPSKAALHVRSEHWPYHSFSGAEIASAESNILLPLYAWMILPCNFVDYLKHICRLEDTFFLKFIFPSFWKPLPLCLYRITHSAGKCFLRRNENVWKGSGGKVGNWMLIKMWNKQNTFWDSDAMDGKKQIRRYKSNSIPMKHKQHSGRTKCQRGLSSTLAIIYYFRPTLKESYAWVQTGRERLLTVFFLSFATSVCFICTFQSTTVCFFIAASSAKKEQRKGWESVEPSSPRRPWLYPFPKECG